MNNCLDIEANGVPLVSEPSHLSENSPLIRFKPYGLNISGGGIRPTLIMKDEKGEQTLAIALSHVEAAVAMAQSNTVGSPVNIHRVAELILKTLEVRPQRCLFDEIKSGHQYARIDFEGKSEKVSELKSIRARAEEVVSFCIQLEVPFFATSDFVLKSRTFFQEIDGLAQSVAVNPRLLNNPHQFMM